MISRKTLAIHIDIVSMAEGRTVVTRYTTLDDRGAESSEEESSLVGPNTSNEKAELLACIRDSAERMSGVL